MEDSGGGEVHRRDCSDRTAESRARNENRPRMIPGAVLVIRDAAHQVVRTCGPR